MITNKSEWLHVEQIDDILQVRDQYSIDSQEWGEWNELKAEWLESKKPSNKEMIITFQEQDLLDYPIGFIHTDELPQIPFEVMKRSLLEHHPTKRHPIPYVIVRHRDQYFFIVREQGSGELRLIGKVGMLGGHISEEDIVEHNLAATVYQSMLRELEEEAGVKESMIESCKLRGLIRSNNGVDADHLGLVYEIELNTNQIKSEEDGILSGVWISKTELASYENRFESWSKIVYDQLLSNS